MTTQPAIEAVLEGMNGAFDGRDGADWFEGLLPTLDGMSSERASTAPHPGRSTIAAHVRHIVYSLEVTNARLAGEPLKTDWDAAWRQPTITPEDWTALQSHLGFERARLEARLRAEPKPSSAFLTSAIKHLTHLGYHIGAIRQILLEVA
jgi:hypothetical protein